MARRSLSDEERKQKHRAAARAWAQANPERVRANQRRWVAENAERVRASSRKATRKRLGHADATGETKSGACEICGDLSDPLHRDHDHATGLFRGWLCRACNQGPRALSGRPRALRKSGCVPEKGRLILDLSH